MKFSDIEGLEAEKKRLLLAAKKERVSPSQLFFGKKDTPVLPLALAYATFLMCQNPASNDSCGSCSNCRRLHELTHPDFLMVIPKISSNQDKYNKVRNEALESFKNFIKKDPYGSYSRWAAYYDKGNKELLIEAEDIRTILQTSSMKSVEGGLKIFFLWCPEKMNLTGANALLKTLEEPPQKTLFIMVSYEYESLLPTITSRMLHINVPFNTEEEILNVLLRRDTPNAHLIAQLTQGKIGEALNYLAESENSYYQYFQKWMRNCWAENLPELIKHSETYAADDKITRANELNFALKMIHLALKIKYDETHIAMVDNKDDFLEKFAKHLSLAMLESIYLLINDAIKHLERNANPRIIHFNLSLSITKSLKSSIHATA